MMTCLLFGLFVSLLVLANVVAGNDFDLLAEIQAAAIEAGYGNMTLEEIRLQHKQETSHHRSLQSCSIQLLDPNNCTTSWSSFVSGTPYRPFVVIPCGVCVMMDLAYSQLYIPGGITVFGMLVIPDDYAITIAVDHIQVFGELHITSTTPVTDTPQVHILLFGNDDEGTPEGKKSISISVGRPVFRGLPDNTPTWRKLYNVVGGDMQYTQILVLDDADNPVIDKWGITAELLVTSHTSDWDDQQLAKIAAMTTLSDGRTQITLNARIRRPTTMLDSEDFACEVALLSRNIKFQGYSDIRDDPNLHHGAHFIVPFTTRGDIVIEGVEFYNFGQQGMLGRYPIHIHVCQDVEGSVVRKNTIRASNQRCVVVHGTHNLTVEENIAYDTKGHCFMTEDGWEQDNTFARNLGALTRIPEMVIPDMGTNGVETDDEPATFWMVNPNNNLIGNVAAGSESSGFWYELRVEARGDWANEHADINPQTMRLGEVRDNVAHSNVNRAFRLYPFGYTPELRAVFHNVMSYRNRQNGIFVHNSNHITFDGGIAADNRVAQIDLDRAEAMEVKNFKVIVESPSFRQLVESQPGVAPSCPNGRSNGIELHTYVREAADAMENGGGAVLKNIDFSGFVGTACEGSPLFFLDDQTFTANFDYYVSISNAVVEPGANTMDFCAAEGVGVDHIFMVDADGSLAPTSIPSSNGAPAAFVSRSPFMTALVDPSKCHDNPTLCHTYCTDTCLRSIRYDVDQGGTEDWVLQVCDTASGRCAEFPAQSTTTAQGAQGNPQRQQIQSTRVGVHRSFLAAIPGGSTYRATFLDNNKRPAWPRYVFPSLQNELCSPSIDSGDVQLIDPGSADCNNLIRNGGADASNHDAVGWVHRSSIGIQVLEGGGRTGNAFTDISPRGRTDIFAQYLDMRCFDDQSSLGRTYVVEAWVKLVSTNNRNAVRRCNPSQGRNACPAIGLIATKFPTVSEGSGAGDYYGYGGGNEAAVEPETTNSVVGTFTGTIRDDFYQIRGTFEITSEYMDAANIYLYVRKNVDGVSMIVDDVSMTLQRRRLRQQQ